MYVISQLIHPTNQIIRIYKSERGLITLVKKKKRGLITYRGKPRKWEE